MLMVIFGAGASYDSSPSDLPNSNKWKDRRPPLANELFEDRPAFGPVVSRFPRCQPIIDRLRRRGEASVEQVLEKLQQESDNNPDRHRQLAAIRFYLHLTLWECVEAWNEVTRGVTNYATLLDQIKHWCKDEQTCLVTFNYDTMLEEALATVGKRICTIRDYIAGDEWRVIKIHGSVNWGRELDTPLETPDRNSAVVALELIERAPDLRISQRYRIVDHHLLRGSQVEPALFPALQK